MAAPAARQMAFSLTYNRHTEYSPGRQGRAARYGGARARERAAPLDFHAQCAIVARWYMASRRAAAFASCSGVRSSFTWGIVASSARPQVFFDISR